MKKIVRLIARLNIGGPAIHVANLCGLDRFGYETVLVYGSASSDEGDMSYLLKGKNVRTILVPEMGREISPLKDAVAFWKVFRIIRQERPDIVHTHTAKAGMVGRIAARLAGVKRVYHTFHGHVFRGYFGKWRTQFFVLSERFLAIMSNRIIVLSARQRDEIKEIVQIPKEKFAIIPLGLDLSRFGRRDRSYVRARGVRDGQAAIGIIGRLTAIKNHRLFLESLDTLKKQGADFKAFVVGDGELKQELIDLAKEKGLAGEVVFTGWIQDLAPLNAGLDYLFLTSKNEGTPVAVIEAMAAGVIVVATDVGGVSDIIADGENGFLVKSLSPVDFTARFLEVHRLSAAEKDAVRARARRAAELFSVERLWKNMDTLYKIN